MPDDIRESLSDIFFRAADHLVICAECLDGLVLEEAFIKSTIGKTYRKGANFVVKGMFDKGTDIGAVKTSAQIGADRNIGTQANTAGIMEKSFQFLCPLREEVCRCYRLGQKKVASNACVFMPSLLNSA